ncbi:MAG: hypothetical protein ACREE2_00260 [Stellaceae bacterium]
MWNITSHDVQQAKGQLQVRRAKLETRYAEETKALDAEFAAIETLERVAEEFAQKHGDGDAPAAAEPMPTAPADRAEDSEPPAAAVMPAEGERPDGSDTPSGLDILKPGSRWRMYRSMRQSDGETATGGAAAPSE